MSRLLIIFLMLILSINIALACTTDGEFDINKCNTTEIAQYCDLNNCTSEELNGLEPEKKGEVLDKVKNYNNIPFPEITKPENRQYINITENEFIAFYNELPGKKQKQIYQHFGEYKGELDQDFFNKVNNEENIEKFWENYEMWDITNVMKGLSMEERIDASLAYLFNEDKMVGLGEFKPETLRRVLAKKGYELTTLKYPENLNFSIRDSRLMVHNSTIPLEVLTGVDSLIITNKSIRMNGVKLENANVTGFSGDNFKVQNSGLINQSYFQLYNSSGVQLLDKNLSMDKAGKLVLNNSVFTGLKNSSVVFENKSLKQGEFHSDKENNSFSFENFTVLLDENDTLQVSKDKGYNITVEENVTVKDYGSSLNRVQLKKGSRYTYIGEVNFSIYAPANFTLYFNETSCDSCGVIKNNKIKLRGEFEYERENSLGIFTNIIEGNGNFTLDGRKRLNISFNGSGVFYSGGVKIKCFDYCSYGFSGLGKPRVINSINNIEFKEKNMYRFIPGNKIILYNKELDNRLRRYFNWPGDR